MRLTEQEIKAIEREAWDYWNGQEFISARHIRADDCVQGYIAGATQERLKAKALIEALTEILKICNWGYAKSPSEMQIK